MIERIAGAALRIKHGDFDYVFSAPPPVRHHHLLRALYENFHEQHGKYVIQPEDQGFVTSAGRFVDRKEGWKIAEAAGQILRNTGPFGTLFSEDMW